jgi:hypothetical protein
VSRHVGAVIGDMMTRHGRSSSAPHGSQRRNRRRCSRWPRVRAFRSPFVIANGQLALFVCRRGSNGGRGHALWLFKR